MTDISMKRPTALFHFYFQDNVPLVPCFVFNESFFCPPISHQCVLRCMFLFGCIRFEMIWGGFEWPHLLTFFLDRPIKSNWSRSEDAYLAYLSLPPRKVAPPFPTWGWMHGGSLCRIKSRFSQPLEAWPDWVSTVSRFLVSGTVNNQ